jgi:flavodoxin I
VYRKQFAVEVKMKALILYRSHYGNTRQVAEEIAKQLEAAGHDATVHRLRRRLPRPKGADLVLVGSPTRMARASWRMMRALRRLRRKGIGDKPLAVFDTYGPVPADPGELQKADKWLHPGAAGRLAAKAKELGLNVFPKTLRCEVRGLKGPLKDGELDKIAAFVKELVAAAGK